jgi:hypothetical protein
VGAGALGGAGLKRPFAHNPIPFWQTICLIEAEKPPCSFVLSRAALLADRVNAAAVFGTTAPETAMCASAKRSYLNHRA